VICTTRHYAGPCKFSSVMHVQASSSHRRFPGSLSAPIPPKPGTETDSSPDHNLASERQQAHTRKRVPTAVPPCLWDGTNKQTSPGREAVLKQRKLPLASNIRPLRLRSACFRERPRFAFVYEGTRRKALISPFVLNQSMVE